jgi:N4-gp56 family major capsid protein
VVEFHRALGYSSTLIRQQPFDAGSALGDRLTFAAAEAMDEVARLAWMAVNANVKVLGTGVAELIADDIINATTALQAADQPPLADGFYGCFLHPYALASLRRETGEKGWTTIAEYATPDSLISGQVAEFQGVRFIPTSRTAVAGTTTLTSVATVFGAKALAYADISSLAVYHVPPTPSTTDPTARKGVISYVFRGGGTLIGRLRRAGDATPTYGVVRINNKVIAP